VIGGVSLGSGTSEVRLTCGRESELRERREFILGRGNVGLGMSEWVWAIA
jgi:hypothetical protein